MTDFADEAFPKMVEILPLPGHFLDMVGFRTPDGTVFLADCLASRETLEKYAVPFIYDVQAYLDTLDKVAAMKAPMFVPAHAPAGKDVADLCVFNRKKVLEVSDIILDLCAVRLSRKYGAFLPVLDEGQRKGSCDICGRFAFVAYGLMEE